MDLKMAFRSAMMRIGNPIKQCKVGNYIIDVDTREGIQRGIYLGCYEPEETKWLQDILKPGMIVVDVGANVGYYSFIAASLVGASGLVYSFEPSNIAFDILVANWSKNNMVINILTQNTALGEEEGQMELFSADGLPDNTYNIHSPSFLDREDQHYLKDGKTGTNMGFKQITTLDKFCKDRMIDHIDFIKIDVEGMEFPVLKGMTTLLKTHSVKWLMIEYLENVRLFSEGSESEAMHNFLKSYDFNLEIYKTYKTNTKASYGNFLYANKLYRGDQTVH